MSEAGPCWTDVQISDAFDVTVRTLENIRQRLVQKGLEAAINRAKRSGTTSTKLDGEQEAYLVALTCSDPPEGRARWSLRLLAEQMLELDYVDSIAHESIRQTLKKTR